MSGILSFQKLNTQAITSSIAITNSTTVTNSVAITPACLDLQMSANMTDRYVPDPALEGQSCLWYITPSDYIGLLMRVLVGLPTQGAFSGGGKTLVPYNAELRKYGNDWPPHRFTMVGTTRLENFRAAILEVFRNGITGSIFELGV
jgi:hypothetical protein